MLVEDAKDPNDPLWPWEAFAAHSTQASLRSLATISVARTWRISSAAEPGAGGEGYITLHCGQPAPPRTPLLVSVLPLRRKPGTEPAPDEKLEHLLTLPRDPLPKGAVRTVKYGPVCRAGAHVVWVTLNGAHVIGSPLHVTVGPSAAQASSCELRALGPNGLPKLPSSGGVSTAEVEATSELTIVLQLRDRYGNRCSADYASELLSEPGAVQVQVARKRAEESLEHDPASVRPQALLPAVGSMAANEVVSKRVYLAGSADGMFTAAAAPGAKAKAGGAGSRGRGKENKDSADEAERATRGLLSIGLRIARAGTHLVTASVRGASLPSCVVVEVRPGPPKAAMSTAHDVVETEATALTRCIAGVPRAVRLVARDACGNATDAPLGKWAACLLGQSEGHVDDPLHEVFIAAGRDGGGTGGLAPAEQHASAWAANAAAVAAAARGDVERGVGASLQTHFELNADGDDSSLPRPHSAVLTYRAARPGRFNLSLTLGGRPIAPSPCVLTTLVPAWGMGLRQAIAGEPAVLYVRIRPEGAFVPGSAAGRKLMHAVSVEALERSTHEVAVCTMRQVVFGGASDAEGADAPGCFLAGGGEVAEVALTAAQASSHWSLSVKIDGRHVLGSPFAWEVKPGPPSAGRSLLHAPWLGESKGAAGVVHTGVLELRDQMGNECLEDCCPPGFVQIWLREEFVVHDHPQPVAQAPRNPFRVETDGAAAAARRLRTMGGASKAASKGGGLTSRSSSLTSSAPSDQLDAYLRSLTTAKKGRTAGVGNAAKPPSRKHLAALGELLGRETEPTVPEENWDERVTVPCEVVPIGGGKYRFAWQARRAGKHSLIAVANGEVLSCSRTIDVHADGAVAPTSELQVR